jgi:cytochrome P450
MHRKYRGLVRQAFGAESVATIGREVIGPLVDGLLDRISAKTTSDLVPDLAERLPVLLIGHIFDLPIQQYGQFASLAARLLAAGFDWPDAVLASQELEALFRTLIDERRRNPGSDIISRLIEARLDDEQLEDDDIISFCRALLPAGMETTSRALSSLMTVLFSERSNWEKLLANRDLVPAAIEELLRWNAPAQAIPKRPTRDLKIGGRIIPAGASLWVYTGHANRDPLHWERPHDYDLTRPISRHLAFSLGPHTCLGMGIARVELEVTLRRILDRLPDMQLDPEAEAPVIHGIFSRSADRVNVITNA